MTSPASPKPANLVIVLSDEHAAQYTGCHGHPIVRTPNIDRLAATGTRYANAYTNSPICMPARAAFATGRYPHQTGCWCNASPYAGTPPTWGHRLQAAGRPVVSIGKLHYRDDEVDAGFDEQRIPMHAVAGIGDLQGAMRQTAPLAPRRKSHVVADEIGAGESSYTRYDRAIAREAVSWLENEAPGLDEPWVLQIGFVAPHFPLIAPEEFFAMYPPESLPLPKACRPEDWPRHPWFDELRKAYITDTFFDDDKRRIATAAYFGLCSFVDHHLGLVMQAIERAGLGQSTRLVYLSDHGDNLGVRGLWQKSNFYEESAHIPLLMSGPGIAAGEVVRTPVSMIDFFPTILDAVGVASDPADRDLPGQSLFRLAQDDRERTVFGEYHAAGAVSGAYMLRRDKWKYVHYAGYPAQLFDLEADPEELTDLASDAAHATTLAGFERELRAMLDPEATDARAKADQAAIIERHGGVEAVLARGSFGATPPPGEKAALG
jgi:choline-sulfatase